MSDTNSSGGNGLGVGTVLFILVLKLTHVIDWSWWWVAAPVWIPAALLVTFGTIAAIAGVSSRR